MSGGKDPAPLMSAEEKLSKKLRLRSLVRKLHDKFPVVHFNDGLHYEEGELLGIVNSIYVEVCKLAQGQIGPHDKSWSISKSYYIFLLRLARILKFFEAILVQ